MKDMKKIWVLALLSAVSATVLIVSNIVAVKLWDFWGIAVDGGVVIFPLSYVLADVIMELYGRKTANFIISMSFVINIVVAMVFLLVGWLPAYMNWQGQEAYMAILGFMPRIVVGSLMAYITSGFLNNWAFNKIKQCTGSSGLWLRALGSSVVAKLVDNLLFKFIAFLGVISFSELLLQTGFAYATGLVLEVILTPLTYILVRKLKKYEIPSC